jgi:hypothetical protein
MRMIAELNHAIRKPARVCSTRTGFSIPNDFFLKSL